jgi:hypothetical protein
VTEAQLLTAVHEAGHVTAWLAAGRRIQSVRIEGDAGLVRPLSRWSTDQAFLARAALCGPAAEAEYRSLPLLDVLQERESAVDYADACGYLKTAEVPPSVLAEVRLLITTHWRLVWIIATQLHARGRLGYRRLESLRRLHVSGRVWL